MRSSFGPPYTSTPSSSSYSSVSPLSYRRSSLTGSSSSHGLGSRDISSVSFREPFSRDSAHRESLPSRLYPSRSSHSTYDRRLPNEGAGGLRGSRDEETSSLLERYSNGSNGRKSSLADNPTLQHLKQRRQQLESDGFAGRKTSLDSVGFAGAGPSAEGIFGSTLHNSPRMDRRDLTRQMTMDAQDVSQNEYLSRLLAAHNRVDDLLRSRGLNSDDERKYLRAWEEIPIIREERYQRVRTPSSSSDSGLSTDNDSDRSNADAPKQDVVDQEPENADGEMLIENEGENEESEFVLPIRRSLERVTFTCTASQERSTDARVRLDIKSPFKKTSYMIPLTSMHKESVEMKCMASAFVTDNCSKVLRGTPATASLTTAFPLKVAWSRVKATFEEPEQGKVDTKMMLRRRKTYDDSVCVQQKNVLASLKRKKVPMMPSSAEISIQHCSFYTQLAKDNFTEKNVRMNLRLTERAPKDCTAIISLPAPPKVAYARLDISLLQQEMLRRSQTVQLPSPKKDVGKLDRSFTLDLGSDRDREKRKVNRLIIPEYFLQSSAEAMEDFKGVRNTLKRVPIIGGFLVGAREKSQQQPQQHPHLRRAGAIRRRPPPLKEQKAPYLDFLPPPSPSPVSASPKNSSAIPMIRIERPPDPDPPPIRRTHSKPIAGYLNLPGSLERSATPSGATKYESQPIAELSETDRILIEQYRRKMHIPRPRAIIRALSPFNAIRAFTSQLRDRCPSPPRAKFLQRRAPRLRSPTPQLCAQPLVLHRVVPQRTTVQRRHRLDVCVDLKRVDFEKHKQRKRPRKKRIRWTPRWRKKCTDEEVEEVEEDEAEEAEEERRAVDDAEVDDSYSKPDRSKTKSITEDGENLTEGEKAMAAAKRRHEDDHQAKLIDYEERRRIEREKEEEELKKLKEKQERRRLEREQEEKEQEELRRAADERRRIEEEERKNKVEEEKRKKEEERSKRSQIMGGTFTTTTAGGRNFTIPKKSDKSNDKFGNIVQAKQEMGMTKDQQDEAKKVFLASVQKGIPPASDLLPSDLKAKIKELHQRICKLEAEKYDLEKRHERQEYDLKELNERQRQVARNAALKKGIDPAEANNTKYPAKVQIVSKYDRQIDRRNFRERRSVFDNKNGYPCFPGVAPPPANYDKVIKSNELPEEGNEEEEPQLARGTARPPPGWGAKPNLEIQAYLNSKDRCPIYVEKVPVADAKPPIEPRPLQLPSVTTK